MCTKNNIGVILMFESLVNSLSLFSLWESHICHGNDVITYVFDVTSLPQYKTNSFTLFASLWACQLYAKWRHNLTGNRKHSRHKVNKVVYDAHSIFLRKPINLAYLILYPITHLCHCVMSVTEGVMIHREENRKCLSFILLLTNKKKTRSVHERWEWGR